MSATVSGRLSGPVPVENFKLAVNIAHLQDAPLIAFENECRKHT